MREHKLTEPLGTLRCVECGDVTQHGIGWRGYLTMEDGDFESWVWDEVDPVAIYYPECAAREFDGP